jgi:outer membrane protein assembly factor BamB
MKGGLVASLILGMPLAACNSRPTGAMTAPTSSSSSSSSPASSTPGGAFPDIADAGDHVTAEAVVWSGPHAIIAGSAGHLDDTPANRDPVRNDGARYHAWLRAVDAQGAERWTRRLDDAREVHVRAMAALGEGVVVAGERRTGDARAYTGWVAALAGDGRERWRLEQLGDPGGTTLKAVAARADGSVLAGGVHGRTAWLIAVDTHGALHWSHDVAGLDEVTAIAASADGGVLAGIAGRTTTHDGRSQLIAVDRSGAPRWTIELPDRGPGELAAITAIGDGGVAVGHAPDDRGRDGAWIVRFAADGKVHASEIVPGAASTSATAVAATADGGFIVAGTTMDAQFHKRGALWRFDPTGKLMWQQTYGQRDGFLRGVAVTPDGGAIVVGAAQTANQPLVPWLFAVDPQGAQR